MKHLLLVRHAKSDHGDPRLPDRERELNARGRRDAPAMGLRLRERGLVPDLIVASSARRTRTTAELMAEVLDYPLASIDLRSELYAASEEIWLDTIHGLPATCGCVMIVGHNPEITAIAGMLTHSAIDNVPTCGVVVLEYAGGEWGRIGRKPPRHWDFDYPKSAQS
jgi:phosphohistidine phosphatase